MDGATKLVSDYISEKGISITAVSEKTGISYNVLYPSLCKNPSRKLRGDELLAVCCFLDVDPRDFYIPPNSIKRTCETK